MINIIIPPNYFEERSYIINVIFKEFLGIDYQLRISDVDIKEYQIILGNNKAAVIIDSFFSHFKEKEYLDINNIPQKINYLKNEFVIENDIPVIFGTDEFEISDERIICGIDLFASAFFMLSRWEEYVNPIRDEHHRFPAIASLAYKNNFLHRPVVNEYVEMLWNLLKHLGIQQERSLRNFELIPTHDIDVPFYWTGWQKELRYAIADIVKRQKVGLGINRIIKSWHYWQKNIDDPYDTFDWLMDRSESINLKSRFYFMGGGITGYDNKYNLDETKIKRIINKIKTRGHIVGFHPSYNTYNEQEQWKLEKKSLENQMKLTISEGRQHYLRFAVPHTWQIWNDNKMKYDSTCGYADKEGFRCGTGDEFTVFNILTRKTLTVKEIPLIIMEGTLIEYQKYSINEAIFKINEFISIAKKYDMKLVLLVHNTFLCNENMKSFYTNILYKI